MNHSIVIAQPSRFVNYEPSDFQTNTNIVKVKLKVAPHDPKVTDRKQSLEVKDIMAFGLAHLQLFFLYAISSNYKVSLKHSSLAHYFPAVTIPFH